MEGSCTCTITLDYLRDGSGGEQNLFNDLIAVNVSYIFISQLISRFLMFYASNDIPLVCAVLFLQCIYENNATNSTN